MKTLSDHGDVGFLAGRSLIPSAQAVAHSEVPGRSPSLPACHPLDLRLSPALGLQDYNCFLSDTSTPLTLGSFHPTDDKTATWSQYKRPPRLLLSLRD